MREEKQSLLRNLPSIDQLLQLLPTQQLLVVYGRSLTIEALRHTLDRARQTILKGSDTTRLVTDEDFIESAQAWLEAILAPTIRPVINATGVIVHTNLGRAPLSQAAVAAVQAVSAGYSTLEFDLDSGKRGSRSVHAENLITKITGAEAATAVNNNAAAVLLMLMTLCQGREVIISRGQLVEIGGGFRVPDVMAQSGARLVEVGTTNRTHLRDYEAAINENTAAILVAHHSNYKIIGFTTEPSLTELAELAHRYNILMLYDQGSGALLDTAPYGLEPEPTVLDGLADGCDIVCFSGDKLLGGPQAGILCGRADLIAQIKRYPLARAVRADKMALAALSATLAHYATDQALTHIPVWRMIAYPLTEIEEEANRWAARLRTSGIDAAVVDGRSTVGGGSLPGTSLPTRLLAVKHSDIEQLAVDLRNHEPPVIGRIQDDLLLLDPRTVLPEQAETLLKALEIYCAKRET
ncbi:MAG: L-seryl-tRNA(Sec) selenium transferase [Ardenticatenaceae bacterium]|nr:L-seryl-tRNA(Sec) selenium transferase [Ardenticatenaceae bacterium]MCB9446300.1 L-seryl-tRNA(Sec) selenium transferase [Ardenticatenaceae bacterium]